jgi:hypothetical protein
MIIVSPSDAKVRGEGRVLTPLVSMPPYAGEAEANVCSRFGPGQAQEFDRVLL